MQNSTEAAQDSETAAQDSGISAFNSCAWGSSLEEVKAAVITAGMQENTDYMVSTEEGITGLTINATQVAGYDTAAGYLFVDDQLAGGLYSVDFPNSEYSILQSKYCAVYGDPVIDQESTGWGPCSLWIDQNGNFVFLSHMCGILYGTPDSSIIDLYSTGISEFHGIDLSAEISKFTNTDGI